MSQTIENQTSTLSENENISRLFLNAAQRGNQMSALFLRAAFENRLPNQKR